MRECEYALHQKTSDIPRTVALPSLVKKNRFAPFFPLAIRSSRIMQNGQIDIQHNGK